MGVRCARFPCGMVAAEAKLQVEKITRALWYIDGNHDKFSARREKIPLVFTQVRLSFAKSSVLCLLTKGCTEV